MDGVKTEPIKWKKTFKPRENSWQFNFQAKRNWQKPPRKMTGVYLYFKPSWKTQSRKTPATRAELFWKINKQSINLNDMQTQINLYP